MYINNQSNQNFTSLNLKQQNLLFSRFGTPKRHQAYKEISAAFDNLPFEVDLIQGKHNRLEATIKNSDNEVVKEVKENTLKGVLNLSPIRFIKNLYKTTVNLNKNS